jgi:alkylhydroperoxidase/carboxymuconolactone decarboxylase family protein YurZ
MADQPPYIEALAEHDSEFAEHVAAMRDASRADGELSRKHKLLIAVAIDAATNYSGGVDSLAAAAREAGATDGEIAETIEVVTALCGVQGLVTGAHAFDDEA